MPSEKRQRQDEGRLARLEQQKMASRRSQRYRQVRSLLLLLGALLIVALLVSVLSGDDDSADGDTTTTTTTVAGDDSDAFAYGSTDCPSDDAERTTSFDDAFKQCIDPDATYTATFDTSEGEVVVELDTAETPGTVNNFVSLARYGYYDDTQLFRTDPSIGIIQGGAPTSNSASDPGPGYTIPDEGDSFTYAPGQLVMARTGAPNSSGGQFFFSVDEAVSALDAQGTYVVFGKVTAGLDVLERILASHVPGGELGGAPSPAVTITSVTISES